MLAHFLVLKANAMRHWTQKLQHWWHVRRGGSGIHVSSMLERRSLGSVFQPMVDLHSGAVIGHEALARAPSSLGECSFGNLLDAAKAQRCQKQLELACLDYAIERWLRAYGKGKLFGNISAQTLVQLHESSAIDTLLQQLRKHKLQPLRMGLDISGYTRIPKVEALVDALRPLRAAGIVIALDDFKASDASMHVWAKVLPNLIKMSPRWTRGIEHKPDQSLAVSSLVRLTNKHNCLLVAKSVESQAELTTMHKLGVDLAQGFYLGSPAPELVTSLNLRARATLSAATA